MDYWDLSVSRSLNDTTEISVMSLMSSEGSNRTVINMIVWKNSLFHQMLFNVSYLVSITWNLFPCLLRIASLWDTITLGKQQNERESDRVKTRQGESLIDLLPLTKAYLLVNNPFSYAFFNGLIHKWDKQHHISITFHQLWTKILTHKSSAYFISKT